MKSFQTLIKKTILITSLLSITSLNAADSIRLTLGINNNSFTAEKVNVLDMNEEEKTQQNQNISLTFESLLDIGEPEGFSIGAYGMGSISLQGENPNDYNGVVIYSPIAIGAIVKYDLGDLIGSLNNFNVYFNGGFSQTEINLKTIEGANYGTRIDYDLNKDFSIGLSGQYYTYQYDLLGLSEEQDFNMYSIGATFTYKFF